MACRRCGALAALASTALLAGCASGPTEPVPAAPASLPATTPDTAPPRVRDSGPFPSPEELEELAEAPLPTEIFALDVARVPEWRLEGPFPEQVGAIPHSEDTLWGALLDEVARRRAGLVLPTQAMYCLARQLGRFYLAHRARPAEGMERFMTARCHASVARVGVAWINADVPRHYDEVEIHGRWKAAVMETLERHLSGGPRTAGIWYGRRGDHAVVMLAYGYRQLHVEPFSPFVGADGRLELAGEALGPVSQVEALVNRGRFGVARCEKLGGLSPPNFRFSCPVDRGDRAARISVSLRQPDRLLATGGLEVLAWPGEETLDVYRVSTYGEAWPALAAESVPADFVALLNDVRRHGGLAPLELDVEQSRAAAELAPHFFAAIHGARPPLEADLVVLGMLAGWSVDGLVQTGHFTAVSVLRTNDLSELLAEALEQPLAREALLAPDAERIAVGSLLETREGRRSLAAVIGTYSLFSEKTHDAMARRVYERLDRARGERGLRSPERLVEVAILCRQAASWVKGGEAPSDALRELLRASAEVLQRPVSGWLSEVGDIDELEFPEQFLNEPSLGVAVSVSHHQPPGEPWGRYVVMLVMAEPEGRGA